MNKTDIINCYESIKPYIHKTPVLTSQWINKFCGVDLFFKCENFQKMGAFKMRGATNAILNLANFEKKNGVVTHSSGNFAQALSLAARNIGARAYIVMPENAPWVKKEAVIGYGGIIIECGNDPLDREEMARKIELETGATFIHPSNNLDVIIGNATACMELLEDYPDIDSIIVPVGGGGLLAGTALAAHFFGSDCKAYGAEPSAVDDAYRSFLSGKIEHNSSTDTIADGLKTQLGDINFPIIQKYVRAIIRVSEDEILFAMKLLLERMKIVVEPSAAVALAAFINRKDDFIKQKVGIILSGGNVDISNLPFKI